jgi:putative transposase
MFLNPYEPLEIAKRFLPQWRQENSLYFITFRLADSVPRGKLSQWRLERDAWLAHHPQPWNDAEAKEFHQSFTSNLEHWLDKGAGDCLLRQQAISEVVAEALTFFQGKRYKLDARGIMPNHVQAPCHPHPGHDLSDILHSWKSFTSNKINLHLQRKGKLWQEGSYNQIVRSDEHLHKLREYIQHNPAKANIMDHPASWLPST